MEKYSVFYRNTLDSILILINKSYSKKDIDLTQKKISQFEKKNNILLNRSLKCYLTYFNNVKLFFPITNIPYSLESIEYSTTKASEKKIRNKINQISKVESWEDFEVNFVEKPILFLNYDEVSSVFSFLINEQTDPILFEYWEGGEITSENTPLSIVFRDSILNKLILLLRKNDLNNWNNIDQFDWLKFHKKLIKHDAKFLNNLISWRHEFNYLMLDFQNSNDSILNFRKYEVEFINFLIKSKNIDHTKL